MPTTTTVQAWASFVELLEDAEYEWLAYPSGNQSNVYGAPDRDYLVCFAAGDPARSNTLMFEMGTPFADGTAVGVLVRVFGMGWALGDQGPIRWCVALYDINTGQVSATKTIESASDPDEEPYTIEFGGASDLWDMDSVDFSIGANTRILVWVEHLTTTMAPNQALIDAVQVDVTYQQADSSTLRGSTGGLGLAGLGLA